MTTSPGEPPEPPLPPGWIREPDGSISVPFDDANIDAVIRLLAIRNAAYADAHPEEDL